LPPIDLTFTKLSKIPKTLNSDPKALHRLSRWRVFLAADSHVVLEGGYITVDCSPARQETMSPARANIPALRFMPAYQRGLVEEELLFSVLKKREQE
jgi:hypothetical protein